MTITSYGSLIPNSLSLACVATAYCTLSLIVVRIDPRVADNMNNGYRQSVGYLTIDPVAMMPQSPLDGGKLAEKKIDNLKLEPPATTDIERLAQEARDAIRAARSRLHMEVEALNADRLEFVRVQEQLAQERKALGEEQSALDIERPKLEAQANEIMQRLEDIGAAEARSEESQRALASKEQELENFRANLEQEKQAHASAVSMLVERESAVEIAETHLAEQRQITEPRFKELERREAEFASRSKEIEAYAAELDGTRKTLLSMQEQLELAQKEVATQREDLLRRLGGTSHMPLVAKTPDRNVGPIADLEMESPGKPKPAASPAAEQFRKLRRDAKRRAIGV